MHRARSWGHTGRSTGSSPGPRGRRGRNHGYRGTATILCRQAPSKLLSSSRLLSDTAVGTALALPRRPPERLAGYAKVTPTLHHRTNPAQDLEGSEYSLVNRRSHQPEVLTVKIIS